MKNGIKVLTCFLLISGVAILAYLWKVLGDRGLLADANGTTGYTTDFELVLGVLGFISLAAGLILFIKANNKNRV